MRYYLDTEFIEGFHKPRFGKNRHFIDLISIGIVGSNCPYDIDGDGNCPRHLKGCPTREYYAISNEFDLRAAWNKWDEEISNYDSFYPEASLPSTKVYWLRENVLFPIWKELEYKDYRSNGNDIKKEFFEILDGMPESERVDFYLDEMHRATWFKPEFTLKRFSQLIKKFGKSNKQIAEEIKEFVSMDYIDAYGKEFTAKVKCDNHYVKSNPEFYGYYADYDWVVFCSLFSRMIDLPKGFPMYCKDLKQMLDEKASMAGIDVGAVKYLHGYPEQTNEHNALSDAKWNKELHEFLIKL